MLLLWLQVENAIRLVFKTQLAEDIVGEAAQICVRNVSCGRKNERTFIFHDIKYSFIIS